MSDKRILVVGGVAGGASFAARMRRLDENAEIILFERGPHISFANCGLPYYVGGVIQNRDALLIQSPERMRNVFQIDVRVMTEVTEVHPDEKFVMVKNVATGEESRESFDHLVLSPGAQPIKPPIPGLADAPAYTVRNVSDVDAIKSYLQSKAAKNAVVVGGGYIGLEMADNLHELGMHVSVIEKAPQILGTMDYDIAAIVSGHILSKGVHLYLGDGVTEFKQKGSLTEVVLESGKSVLADFIILAIGVRPDVQFLTGSGIELGARGGIRVNEYMQTNFPDIYALGDATETIDFNTGNQALIPLAGPANKQGRLLADHIAGIKKAYKGTQGTAIAKVFDMTVAATGSNERTLTALGTEFLTAITLPKSHAGYYPGAMPMTIKTHFTPDGTILGAQIAGYGGVAKSIDVLATALRQKMTVYDLQELELAYAPPFNAAKDPVNMVGYVAENMLSGRMPAVSWQEVESGIAGAIILDVGEAEERMLGAIDGSYHIPLGELRGRLNELPQGQKIVVYCQVGLRAYIATSILLQRGFDAVVLTGGYKHYATVTKALAAIANQDYQFGGKDGDYKDMSKQDVYSSETAEQHSNRREVATVQLDACGLSCPGPIVEVYKKMNQLSAGDMLEVLASDPGFVNDITAWCKRTGHELLEAGKKGVHFRALIRKGGKLPAVQSTAGNLPNDKTIVVFSSDLDKVIAAFIIANGAAAMGRKITMFFTFWGLNALRKPTGRTPAKGFMDRMFGLMMPRGSKRLGLSKLHMLGIGPKLIRHTMKKKNISSLEQLIVQAKENGVRLVACNMSMDVMGIKQEELLDGIEIGGVAAYLGDAEESNHNLFI